MATGRIGARPDRARLRVGDLPLVLYLADDLLVGDPYRQRPWPAGMNQRVSGQLGDRAHKVAGAAWRKLRLQRAGCGEPPDIGQVSPVAEHFGIIRWDAQGAGHPGSNALGRVTVIPPQTASARSLGCCPAQVIPFTDRAAGCPPDRAWEIAAQGRQSARRSQVAWPHSCAVDAVAGGGPQG